MSTSFWWLATWLSLVTLANAQALRAIREEIVRWVPRLGVYAFEPKDRSPF